MIEQLDRALRWTLPRIANVKVQRMAYLTAAFFRESVRDQIPVRAATLAFWTLVTIVPVLVLGASILRPMGLDQIAYKVVISAFLAGSVNGVAEQLEVWTNAVDFGKLGVVGIVGVLFSSSRIYFSVESAYNTVWNSRARRAWATRFIQYYTILTLVPLLLAYGVGYFALVDAEIGRNWGSVIMPFVVTTVAFVGALRILPEAEVEWKSALLGGLASAIAFELAKVGFNAYVNVFGGGDTASKIYGSIWFFPVFLLWLHMLWMIVLFGAEFAYVFQRREDLIVGEVRRLEGEHAARRHADALFGLQCLMVVAQRYAEGLGATPEPVVTRILRADPQYVLSALETLEQAGVLGESHLGYLPAMPLEVLTVREVVLRYRNETRPIIREGAPGADLVAELLAPGAERLDQPIAELLREGP